jgi:hypothetical protein
MSVLCPAAYRRLITWLHLRIAWMRLLLALDRRADE